jgi:hypothetical protein
MALVVLGVVLGFFFVRRDAVSRGRYYQSIFCACRASRCRISERWPHTSDR